MKKLFTLLLIVMSITLTAQTYVNLSEMNGDIDLGGNCPNFQEQEVFITTGDANLNGNVVRLRNARLEIMGKYNGPGEIDGCGQATVYIQGAIQNGGEIDESNVEVTGDPLRTNTYLLKSEYNYSRGTKLLTFKTPMRVQVYNMLGQIFIDTTSDSINLSQLSEGLVLVKTEKGFIKLVR